MGSKTPSTGLRHPSRVPESYARSVWQLAAPPPPPDPAGRFITGQQHVDRVLLISPADSTQPVTWFRLFLNLIYFASSSSLRPVVSRFLLLSLGRFISPRQAACTVQLFVTGTD